MLLDLVAGTGLVALMIAANTAETSFRLRVPVFSVAPVVAALCAVSLRTLAPATILPIIVVATVTSAATELPGVRRAIARTLPMVDNQSPVHVVSIAVLAGASVPTIVGPAIRGLSLFASLTILAAAVTAAGYPFRRRLPATLRRLQGPKLGLRAAIAAVAGGLVLAASILLVAGVTGQKLVGLAPRAGVPLRLLSGVAAAAAVEIALRGGLRPRIGTPVAAAGFALLRTPALMSAATLHLGLIGLVLGLTWPRAGTWACVIIEVTIVVALVAAT